MTKLRGLCIHGLMHPLHGQSPKGLNCVPYPAKRLRVVLAFLKDAEETESEDMMFEEEVEDRQWLALKMEDSLESRNTVPRS